VHLVQEGVDFEKTFTLVVKWNTISSIVAVVAHSKWDIFHLDVRTTFTNGDLKEKVFMM
jgi:hypothetical protein